MKSCSVGVREEGTLRSFKCTQEGIKEKNQTNSKQTGKEKTKNTKQNQKPPNI